MAASKPPQILQLTPQSEIIFEGPFDQVVTSYLDLKNPSNEKVCFKVKTTAPRCYCVRPNSGMIEPDNKVKIAIMLQPQTNHEKDSQADRSKHKFMVQSTIIRANSAETSDSVWQNLSPEDIMDSKLRCVFLTASSIQNKGGLDTEVDLLKDHSNKNKSNLSKSSSSSNTPALDTNVTTQQQQLGNQKLQQTAAGDSSRSSKYPVQSEVVGNTHRGIDVDKDGRVLVSESKAKKSNRMASESSHNLTSSFLQPMSDDYKIVLVSLAMLFIGVILGKYII